MNTKIFLPLIVLVILTLACAPAAEIANLFAQENFQEMSVSAKLVSGGTDQTPAAAPASVQADQPANDSIAAPAAEPVSDTSASQPLDAGSTTAAGTYPIVDTAQGQCYGDTQTIDCPQEGSAYYGQDAQYSGNQPRYTDNGDSTGGQPQEGESPEFAPQGSSGRPPGGDQSPP